MNVALRPDRLDYISLCTGGAGLDVGIELAIPAARPVVCMEREAVAVARLASAMEDGLLAPAPIWSDVRTFAGRPWRGLVDGLIGGIPCQPHSVAGQQLGEEDERDLWAPARRIIVQARPWFVLIENVEGMLHTGGLERVCRDLRRLRFEVEVGLFSASECGATHQRNASSSLRWPTPDASVMNDGEGPETFFARQARQKAKGINGNGMGMPLTIAATTWPTPAARDYKGANGPDHLKNGTGRLHQDQLPNFVEHIWSTPRASDAEKGGPNQSFGAGGIPLPAQAAQWQTPAVADTEGGRKTRSGPRSTEPLLNGQAEIVSNAASSHRDLPTSTDGSPTSNSGRSLNPRFVGWLMGWPDGWTSFECSATELSAFKQRMRSALSQLVLHDAPPAQNDLFG
jgi:site-specific DNA-cytosine methylase